MKSIKLLSLAIFCNIAFSCTKKVEGSPIADNIDSTQATAVTNALAQEEQPEDELLKEAKEKPLTTVAFSETDHNFGEIKKGEKVEHVFEVTNTGKNPLIISNVKPGCGCTVPDYTKEPILPGKKGKITLHFDSTNFDGAVNKIADVYVNVEKAPVRLTFSANILP
ncbi:Protein of unknown function [Epilithonimonas bovis DSM 19482]|uniref:DUF1573 domain-containing protein n=1 Tax=Epilithonimonas bovis DSM 19482 TaxID=1121284 RepID=A0A1U7PYB3_9FLAO|nr:DUF1573 domain-containing protein [Epilithonimonas bovis]SIT98851.1 Protein of unknown function [Epilithonimonas bovis DSM 19482]